MPRITIDARKYFDFGIGVYIQNLVAHLARLRTRHSFRLLVSPEDAQKVPAPGGWELRVIPYEKYSFGEFFSMGRRLETGEDSLYHAPHYTLPLGIKARCVVTIHDLTHLRFPEFFSLAQRSYAYVMMQHAIRSAEVIITTSEFSKRDMVRMFRLEEDRIRAIHLGVSPHFQLPVKKTAVTGFRKKFHLTHPYVLFVGNVKPHKAADTLMAAFASVRHTFPELELVFVGSNGSGRTAKSVRMEYFAQGNVRRLGYLNDEEIVLAYHAAEMLVMPSLYEGFGLPVLEAMACHTPVIISDGGSLPEIASNAAIVVKKRNPRMLAQAITAVLEDPRLKHELVQKGKKRVRDFSWDTTAAKTLEIYDRMAQDTHSRKRT